MMETGPKGRSQPRCDLWTQDEVKLMGELWERDVPIQAIADLLGRTRRSVAIKAFRVGLKSRRRNGKSIQMSEDPTARMRNCLSCNHLFYSEGRGNRICQSCKNKDDWATGNDYAFDGEFRDR